MFRFMYFAGALTLALTAAPGRAAERCDTYSVVPGDTLRLIAERYYGSRDLSPIIYDANREVVGANPNIIEIGMELDIPCRAGMHMPEPEPEPEPDPEPTAFVATITPTPGETAIPATREQAPQFISQAGNSPFVGADNSGVIPDILAAALKRSGFEGSLDITRPASTSTVLQASVQPEALLAFPWVLPDCTSPVTLSPQSAYICANYTFSDPLYEITLGIFTLSGNPLAMADSDAAFAGKTICVPQFYTDDLLRSSGILAANATAVLANDFQSCLAGLQSGSFDAVVADYQSFARFAPQDGSLADIPAFAQSATLHAIAYSQNPAAGEVLSMLNRGLKEILISGEWFAIVTDHLSQMRF